MATQTYDFPAGRINEIKGETLAHAVPVEVLAKGCKMKKMPKNKGDNITYRRFLPFGATTTDANTINRWTVDELAHLTQEGVTPDADTLTPQDVNVQLQQYACLYVYTDKVADLYEDDIPEEMKIQTGERMGLVREMIRWAAVKAGTNKVYAGGTTRGTVDEPIGLNVLRRMQKTLQANHAKMKTRMLGASEKYETFAVEAGFIVFSHTDCEPDIRDIPGFIPCAKYGNKEPISPHELGSVERMRFITSPELNAIDDSGAAVGSTGLVSTSGTSIDVYPYIVCAEDGVYDVALRGMDSFDFTHLPVTQKDKNDILGQRGYVGAKFWSAVKAVNNGWFGVIEAGVTDI